MGEAKIYRDKNGLYHNEYGVSSFQVRGLQGRIQDSEEEQHTGDGSERPARPGEKYVTPFFEQLSFDGSINGRIGHIKINADSKLRRGIPNEREKK